MIKHRYIANLKLLIYVYKYIIIKYKKKGLEGAFGGKIMLKNWKKKVLAMLLIFTMTFSNFALVGKTYAAYFIDGIFGGKEDTGDTGSINVEFDAYFRANQNSNQSKTASSDIKATGLYVGLNVKVKNSGYLKDAKILFGDEEEVNFAVQAENLVEENDKIQSFENDELYLVQLNAGTEVEIEFPINYQYKKYVEEEMISKTNKIKFEGVYLNDNAEEIKVQKTVDLTLSWEDQREVEASSEITKYIGFNQDGNSGIILQDSVTVDSKTDDISLPIKDSTVEVTVPEIDGVKPETVNVVAKSLVGTSGKETSETEFDETNWKYDANSNKVTINVSNKSELVSTQNENDILIDETAPKKEMYYSESGADNFLITYTYKNVAIGEREISTKVNATLNEFGTTKLTDEKEEKISLKDEVGQIVTYSNETTTNSISKGYTYLNYNNEETKYEMEIDNKLVFNVSYKDIVEGLFYEDSGNQYVSKSGETYNQDDLYYKTLKISKDNFVEMLGEAGFVKIYNNNEEIFTINNETNPNEDGNIEISFDNTVKNIQIETSKPIKDGNLVVNTVRAYSNVSYDKETYKNFDRLTINTVGRAKYIYLEDLVDSGNSNLDVKLDDTKTEASIEIGQDSLSTLAMNNNVEIKVELNNEKITSDVYGNSRFQIKLPEYVETVEVTDYSIVYGEGLELSNVQGFVDNGRAYIDIQVAGKQNALSSGIISKGTNIVLHANIKVDLFAPASDADFELTYINDDATNYGENNEVGFAKTTVTYSAPSGVVSVNSISVDNKTITSVNQGKMIEEIPIHSDNKVAKAELTIMNNEKNTVSDLVIIGRVPFEGVKDLTTGEDLGTTLNTKMVSRLVPENMNGAEFRIYYSENGTATKELNDSSNGWTENPSSLEKVKSFLIVPVDSNYQMAAATKIRFTYEYEIPGNLEHNEDIFGTFGTYFTNNTAVAEISEVSKADLVGLTTGVGPELKLETSVNKTEINEYEEFEITTTLTNIGEIEAKNIVVEIPIPENTNYKSVETNNTNVKIDNDGAKIICTLDALESGKTVNFKAVVEASSVHRIYVTSSQTTATKVYSTVTATDLDTVLKSEEKEVTIKLADLKVNLENSNLDKILYKGNEVEFYIRVQNLQKEPLNNLVVSMKIPEIFEFKEGTELGIAEDGLRVANIKDAIYDEASRTVTWTVDEITYMQMATLHLTMDIGDIPANSTMEQYPMVANVRVNSQEYVSNTETLKVGKPTLTINQTTSTTNTYVKEGETINYQFSIKNEGTVLAQQVRVIDNIPEGLVVKSVSYESNGIVTNKAVSEKDKVTIGSSIPAGDTLTVNIAAVATSLNGRGERSVTNAATVSAKNVDSVESNNITHIIESSGNTVSGQGEKSTGKASSSTDDTLSISKTYKITGTAWLDKNGNGAREDDEPLMKGIKATLVDSDNGIIKKTTVTNSEGGYTFGGVYNGNYIVIFDYDTVRYTVTTYQKEGVTLNVNSDVITTKIEQDGKLRIGAVTHVITISDGSISNVDIGLVDALKFDLRLNMGISKITTNTSKGTETKTYENARLTKTEIGAKQVAGSSVYIEYTLTVSNEGEISGFAKKVADYIPEEMEFNSGLDNNQNWFTGSDGNIYTTQLSNVELQPGETRTFKLVLTKHLTDDNLGTVSNTAEIVEDYNIYGVSDLDSNPANKAQNEDDFARADSYLSVRTGEEFIYVSVIITTILLLGIAVIVIRLKVKSKITAKGGV